MLDTSTNIPQPHYDALRFNQNGIMQVGIFAAGVLLGVLISVLLLGSRPNAVTQDIAQQPAQLAQASDSAEPASIPPVAQAKTLADMRGYLRIGKADAPVQVVIFSDPRCPYCKSFAKGAGQQLLNSEYVTEGKVAFVYRHMPVLGAPSRFISKALECAAKQGHFQAAHDQLYASPSADTLDESGLAKWASDLKLDGAALTQCVNDPETANAVQADIDIGTKLGVRGTPSMFVAGKPVMGDVPFDLLKSTVDEALREQQ
jgi:protein-disulfide isomerase